MENKIKFTKENTAAVKGIAIIFLLCYHCFSNESRLYGAQVSFWPLSQETVFMIARCMVTCVGVFAFLSAYGLTKTLKTMYKEYEFTSHDAFMFVIKRYVKLFFLFALPFFVCATVTFLLDYSRYRGGLWENIAAVVMDLFGVGHIFGTQMMVNTWWFLSLEILIIVFMPFMVRFYKKYSWLMIIMVLLPGSFMLQKHVHLTKYFLVVPIAVCFADQNILERLREFVPGKNRILGKILKFVVLTAALLILYKIYDTRWGIEHFEFALNGIIPPVLIWWAYEFVIELPVINQILVFLGKHSADIFYVHTFIRALWLKELTYSFGHVAFIFLFVLGTSLIISFLLDFIRKYFFYNQIAGALTVRFLTWIDRVLYKG